MTVVFYNEFKEQFALGNINLAASPGGDIIKVILVGTTYFPNADTDRFYSHVQPYEIVGTGYIPGDYVLTGKTLTKDLTNDWVVFAANNPSWDPSTITNAKGAILYKDTGNATTSPLIGYYEFDQPASSSNGAFTIVWASNGILRLQ